MQTDSKQIYKELAEETGKSEQMYKDLGNFIWAETYSMTRHPQSLITKLRGIGSWHLRRKRMNQLITNHPLAHTDRKIEDFTNEKDYNDWVWRKELRTNFSARLEDYKEYVDIRSAVREQRRQRNEAKLLLEANKRKDEGTSSS